MSDRFSHLSSSPHSVKIISVIMNLDSNIQLYFFPLNLRDFMEGTMEKTNKMLAFLHPIIEEADPELEDFLIRYVSNYINFNLLVVKYST